MAEEDVVRQGNGFGPAGRAALEHRQRPHTRPRVVQIGQQRHTPSAGEEGNGMLEWGRLRDGLRLPSALVPEEMRLRRPERPQEQMWRARLIAGEEHAVPPR